MPEISRRTFLGSAPALAAVAAACTRPPYDPAAFSVPSSSDVALLPAASYDIDLVDLVTRGLGLLKVDLHRRRVLLKPNMVEYEKGTVINTHPKLVAAAAEAALKAGAESVVVAEGAGHRRDAEYLVVSTGLYDYLKDLGVRFVDLNHDDVRRVPLRSHFTTLQEMAFSVELLRSDFVISMPKLKTHHWAGMTCSMKNLFGVVPGAVYGWPKNLLHLRGIHNSILDLATTVRPSLAIVDGIVGMEGDGPIMGRPRHVGTIAMGADVVAVDATCARIMGLNPERIPYLAQAASFLGNIGAGRIRQRGERLDRFQTAFQLLDTFAWLRG